MTDPDPKTIEVPADSLAGFIASFQAGAIHDEGTAKLRDAVSAALSLNKPAAISLQVNITPTGGGRMVIATPTITAKIPQPKSSSVFYADDIGGLHRNDPFQHKLELDQPPAIETTAVDTTAAPAAVTVTPPPAPPITGP